MGASYSLNYQTGRFCRACDSCGSIDKVRVVKCPHGWCPPIALCPECKATGKFTGKDKHVDCLTASIESDKKEAERKALLEAGVPLRCSAMQTKDGSKVHVLFQTAYSRDSETIGYYMTKEIYHAIPLLDNASPENYRAFGEIEEAPNDFVW